MSALIPVKPIFIVANNPRSDEPLWPRPHGSAGFMLAKMVNAAVGWSEAEYLARTERIALISRAGVSLKANGDGHAMDMAIEAANAAKARVGERRALCLGRVTQVIMGAPEEPFVWCDELAYFPHPGRNPWFSDSLNIERAVQFLREYLQNDDR